MISIIVPIYNVEKYLQRCVRSVQNQSFSDYEIILVDDGATDGSGRLCDELDARFGGKFALLVRFHKMTHGVRLGKEARKAVFNVTDYPDMQELMQVTDVGITDYSSWIFDYVLTRRPGFLFAPDADAYETSTGLCYPLAAAPFPVARNVDELLSAIRSFDAEGFEERVEAFLRGKQCTDDGHASERIADWIAGAMDGERGGSDHV